VFLQPDSDLSFGRGESDSVVKVICKFDQQTDADKLIFLIRRTRRKIFSVSAKLSWTRIEDEEDDRNEDSMTMSESDASDMDEFESMPTIPWRNEVDDFQMDSRPDEADDDRHDHFLFMQDGVLRRRNLNEDLRNPGFFVPENIRQEMWITRRLSEGLK
jgi:hypothetical protein